MLRDECISCSIRLRLLDLDWQLMTQANGANVHRTANARTQTVGALSYIQVGIAKCETCKRFLERAVNVMNRQDVA